MSRGQENQVVDESQQQNATAAKNAQQSFNASQSDIGDYQDQLAKFAAGNPYAKGGELQTAQDQVLSNTADASGRAAGEALQSQAVRTGQNAGGAIAATEAMQQENERNLSSQEAKANEDRINSGAQYGEDVLKAGEVPATLEAGLTGQQLGAQNNSLETQEKAAQTPSFGEELMGGVLNAGQAFAEGFGKTHGCWIAARLFGGWFDPRTARLRLWLNYSFGEKWYGKPLTRLYGHFGERIANHWMPRSPLLTGILSRVFAVALRKAEEWTLKNEGARIFDEYEHWMRMRRNTGPITNEKTVSDRAVQIAGKVR